MNPIETIQPQYQHQENPYQNPYPQMNNEQTPMQMQHNINLQQNPDSHDIKNYIMSVTQVIQDKKPDFCVYFFGCNQEKQYDIHKASQGELKPSPNTEFLHGKEKSNACLRFCLSNQCRPYKFEYQNLNSQGNSQYFILEKDCQLTCCCFNRPVVKAYLMDNGNKIYLGKIIYNFDCCDYTFNIVDKNDQKLNFVNGSCCQLGHLCRMYPFDCCQEVDFDNKYSQGQKKQTNKTGRGFFLNCLTDANRIRTSLPQELTWEQRALIILGFQLIDFSMFRMFHNNKCC